MIDLDEMAQATSQLEPLPRRRSPLAALVCFGTPELGQVVEIVQFDEALAGIAATVGELLVECEPRGGRDGPGHGDWPGSRPGSRPHTAHERSSTTSATRFPVCGLSEGQLGRRSVATSLGSELLTRHAPHARRPEAATSHATCTTSASW